MYKGLYRIALASAFMSGLLACASAAEEQGPDVLQGSYNREQAEQGRAVFNDVCQRCHIPRDFRAIIPQSEYTVAIIGDYFELITLTMPQDSPGSLPEQQYRDVMAYLLSLNGFPAAEEE